MSTPVAHKYRKRPLVITAYQTLEPLDITTLEGVMHANSGDYIITGIKGEQYPCSRCIFEESYEQVASVPEDFPSSSGATSTQAKTRCDGPAAVKHTAHLPHFLPHHRHPH